MLYLILQSCTDLLDVSHLKAPTTAMSSAMMQWVPD